ncbi:MAG: hypothetical protein CMJ47_00710 [Planctomyces sp.]|nr:hypothetical protein [Planctomyces sp.]
MESAARPSRIQRNGPGKEGKRPADASCPACILIQDELARPASQENSQQLIWSSDDPDDSQTAPRTKKRTPFVRKGVRLYFEVGMTGFEPATS